MVNTNLLKIHKIRHGLGKLENCHECGETFARTGQLKQHEIIHDGENPHRCRQCEKSFTIEDILNYSHISMNLYFLLFLSNMYSFHVIT